MEKLFVTYHQCDESHFRTLTSNSLGVSTNDVEFDCTYFTRLYLAFNGTAPDLLIVEDTVSELVSMHRKYINVSTIEGVLYIDVYSENSKLAWDLADLLVTKDFQGALLESCNKLTHILGSEDVFAMVTERVAFDNAEVDIFDAELNFEVT